MIVYNKSKDSSTRRGWQNMSSVNNCDIMQCQVNYYNINFNNGTIDEPEFDSSEIIDW